MRTLYIIITIFLMVLGLNAQNPANVKWRQFKTQNFKVIYPNGLDLEASYAAELLEKSHSLTTQKYNNKPKPIKLYLFNQSSISNGFVALGPKRMVWYTTPSQQTQMLGNSDWFQTLAIHEFRHVLQYSKLDTNLIDFASTLMGDIGKGIAFNWAYPAWYFEGDAVYAETKYSNSGRGRMPSFTRHFYALEEENIRYKYQKAYLGSYRHYFPNIYHLGFVMTKHIIDSYGDSVYLKAIENTSTYPFIPSAFSYALKKQTGFNAKRTYYNCLDSMLVSKKSITNTEPNTNFNKIHTSKNKHYTNYLYPFPYGSKSYIAYKKGFNHSGEICILNNPSEQKLINISTTDKIHSNGSLVVWSSVIPDIRWPEKSYADIFIYDIKNDRKKRLTKKQRYFAPAISPNGKYIATIEMNELMQCSIIILSAENGNVISKVKAPTGAFYRTPSWSSDNNSIVFTETHGQQNFLVNYNLKNNKLTIINSFGSENVSMPIFYDKYILFNAPYNASDAICAIDTVSLEQYVVATSKNGIYNASIDYRTNKLITQNYTITGQQVITFNIDTTNWIKLPNWYFTDGVSANLVWNRNRSENIFENTTIGNVKIQDSKKYHAILNLPKIHSWMPYAATNGVGFGINAGNELETTFATGGIEYYPKDKATRTYANIMYGALPIEIGFNFSKGRLYNQDTLDNNDFLKIDEDVLGLALGLPINLSVNNFNNFISIYSGFDMVNHKKHYENNSSEVDINLFSRGIDISLTKQMAYRDLTPKLGLELSNNAYYNSGKTKEFKSRMTTKAAIYIPAPLNHGFKISYGIESNNTDDQSTFIYHLSTDLDHINGYSSHPYLADKLTNIKAQYTLPLIYPDFPIWSILYTKRIRANLFINHGHYTKKLYQNVDFNSAGIELHGEFHFFNLPFAIELGVRASYLEYFDDMSYEFMLMGVPF